MPKWQVTMTVAVILAGAVALGAQGGSAADEKELQQFRLTTEGLGKVDVAAQAFAKNLQSDPRMKKWLDAKRELEALENKDELTEADERRLEQLEAVIESEPYGVEGGSLSEMAAQFAKIPPVVSALKTAGMTPRDFAKFVAAMTQSAMVHAVQKDGAKMPLPPGVSAENVKFAGDHEAEIERIGKLLALTAR